MFMLNFSLMTHTLLSMNYSNEMKWSFILLFIVCQYLCITSMMSYTGASVQVVSICIYSSRFNGGQNSWEIHPNIELVLELEILICPPETHSYLENILILSGYHTISKGWYKDKASIFELFYTKAYVVFYLLKNLIRTLFESYKTIHFHSSKH
jgi:hypothetical protein